MAELRYLALDLGAESGRAVIGHLDGRSLQLEEIHRFPNGPVLVNGHLHWMFCGCSARSNAVSNWP